MTTIPDIINVIGSETIQRLCGVSEYSIRAAKRDGRFPASWFDLLETECAQRGVECPRYLFNFKGAA